MTDLSNKVAIVTGAGRGIGAATARALAARGAKVMLAARGVADCEALAGELAAEGRAAAAMACDVSDYGAVEALVEGCCRRFGGLDILINNAGVIEPIARLGACDPAEWARSVTINLVGAYHAVRASLPALQAAGGGVVVNVSSGAAHRPYEGWSAYCAGKAGLAMLTQSMALELGPLGVRVYGLQPGTVFTAMQEKIKASGINPVSQVDPADHPPAEDPALAIVWLCGAAAADLAGRELSIRDPDLRTAVGLPL
ncbi:MAG TPA: SDR family oxidoreductase [Kiloniellaceae bacterium]|nr:SDR family oxidoreductase [Kiloniellaceae bacterium]